MTQKEPYVKVISLTEEDFSAARVLYRNDKLIANYAWDTGIAIGYFLAGLKEGMILGSYCATCRKTVTPPRIVCEWCFRPMQRFVQLSDTGTVNTFSICYVTWDVKRITTPEIPAVIEIDGASAGHGFLHKLGEVHPDEVQIGMRVQAVWRPPEERSGSITDILYFRKI
ncbi:MAG: Zn-ribbon domain-containing OB-fold protein [Anaerolineales bacterium]